MTTPRRPLIAGNWKMHGTLASLVELQELVRGVADGLARDLDLVICPPATILSACHGILGDIVAVGGQDCHEEEEGPYTGSLSAPMLKDVGASYAIVGHSERRTDYDESSALVRAKAQAAIDAGLVALVCLGENEAQRDAGETLDVLRRQLDESLPDVTTAANTVVAYEPLWAIGSGQVPSSGDVVDAHALIRSRLSERFGEETASTMRVVYGGSVKPDNAEELLNLADVDGALVGGASLKADDFLAIARAKKVRQGL